MDYLLLVVLLVLLVTLLIKRDLSKVYTGLFFNMLGVGIFSNFPILS